MLKLILRWWQTNALTIAILTLCIILGLSLMNTGSMPIKTFDQSDKLGHFIAYFVLVCTWLMVVVTKKIRIHKGILFILLAGFGILIEWIQSILTTYRTADYKDAIANTIGLILGFIVFHLVYPKIKAINLEVK